METKNEKTKLQKIKERLEQKMTRAIVAAIEDGAEYEVYSDGSLYVDKLYLAPKFGTKYHGIVLGIDAPEIEQLFELSKNDLRKRAKELRAELEEIEKQLKSE